MEIIEIINWLTKEKSYNISINYAEDLDGNEIAECFQHQYPNIKAVISFAKIERLSIGMIIVGLNLKQRKK